MIFTFIFTQVLQMYLPFCGISISNAKLFSESRKEYERSRVRIYELCFFIKDLLCSYWRGDSIFISVVKQLNFTTDRLPHLKFTVAIC